MSVGKKKAEALPSWCGGTLYDLIDARTDLSDQAYALRFGLAEDWADLKGRIVERRRGTAAFWWWGCSCGFREKHRGDFAGAVCPKCLTGQLVKCTLDEANAAETAEAEKMNEVRERSFRASLFERNQSRLSQGLLALTEAEHRAELRKEAELRSERSRV